MSYTSEIMYAGRISSHGEITDLTSGFKLKDEKPFTIYIKAIDDSNDTLRLVAKMKLYKDTEASECPVNTDSWNPILISELGVNSINLSLYRVFWGAGDDAEAE